MNVTECFDKIKQLVGDIRYITGVKFTGDVKCPNCGMIIPFKIRWSINYSNIVTLCPHCPKCQKPHVFSINVEWNTSWPTSTEIEKQERDDET